VSDDRRDSDQPSTPKLDTEVPHSARIWNYWQGGKDHYLIDRQVGDQIIATNPHIEEIARAQRYFLVRAVRYLAAEAGIRQFLDVGTGLPTADNTHNIAQQVDPSCRVVYVDHDPLVLVHARALLTSTPEGACDYIDADVRDPATILGQAARTLDFSKPIALILLGITAHITDDDQAYAAVHRLIDALASGSFLVLCDDTEVFHPDEMAEMIRQWNAASDNPRVNRSPERIARLFDGLEPVEPGIVSVSLWRPDVTSLGEAQEVDDFGGVARKP
jgi:S-adenosyl methyltransferase